MDGIGIVTTLTKEQNKLLALGIALLQEQSLMDAIELCIKQSVSRKPEAHDQLDSSIESRNSRYAYVSTHQIAIGLESSKQIDDPTNKNPMKNDIRMGLAYQKEAPSTQDEDAKSEGMRAIISAIASDPQILNDTNTLDQITTEIGRTLCSFAMIPEEDMDINMSLEAMGIDSLVSIELRNWWRGTLGVDISVLEMTSAGTVGRLGILAIESLKKKHGLAGEGGVDSKGAMQMELVSRFESSDDDANVDAIIHNCAVITMAASFESLYKPNIDATIELLKMALSSRRPLKFVYVSGSGKLDQEQPIELLAQEISPHFGYSQTKLMAERIVLEVISQMPRGQNRVSVVKPGLIAGAPGHGVANLDDLIWHLFATIAATKIFPEYERNAWFYISGVNSIAASITQQLFASTNIEAFVDINDGIFVSDFWQLLANELGIPYASQEPDEWIKGVMEQAPDTVNSQLMPEISQIIKNNSSVFPVEAPCSIEVTERVRLSLQSTIQHLQRVGYFETSPTSEQEKLLESTIRRSRN